MEIIFATGNKGKLKEVRSIFQKTDIKILSLEDIGFDEEIEETGITFEENAFIKAITLFEKFSLPVIADDSGLEVEQLDNRPGIYSARYAGINATYEDNNLKLVSELKEYEYPHKARFVCCAVFVNKEKKLSVHGELTGEIINNYKGQNGFGYDPIFKPDEFDFTLAEIKLEEKNKISHRAKAFNELNVKLKGLFT